MRVGIFLLVISSLVISTNAQPTDLWYVESWKKGTRKIQEQKLEIKLTRQSPDFKAAIKDTSGKIQYELFIAPNRQEKKADGIHFWNVTLLKAQGVFSKLANDDRVDLLKPTNDPFQDSFGWEDMMGMFNPRCDDQHIYKDNACHPNEWFLVKRVIKVEMFYVIMQVKGYQHEEGRGPKLSTLTLNIEFANTFTKPT